MKKLLYSVSISLILWMIIAFTQKSMAEKNNQSITLANIEVLDTTENPIPECDKAGGFCIKGPIVISGVHFEKD